jgi:hypothetical protein
MKMPCSTYGREERCILGFSGGGRLQRRNHLEDQGVDGRIILKMDRDVGWGSMDWIDLAQDRDRWWAVVNAVMNLQVP